MTRGRTVIVSLLLLIAAPLHGQTPHHKPSSPQLQSSLSKVGDTRPLIQQMVDAVSSDNLVNTIQGLQSFGTRYELSPQQEAAADWIIKELSWWGLKAESDWHQFGSQTFTDADLINQDTAWIVGPTILWTADGGATWWSRNVQRGSGTYYFLYGIDFSTPRIGWAVGTGGTILQTNDGGVNWYLKQAFTSRNVYDVGFASENRGIIVGTDGAIFRTTDGGVNWLLAHNPGTSATLREVEILDSLRMWVVGDGGTIVHSSDGGLTWTVQESGTRNMLRGIDFLNPRLGWAVGYDLTVRRTTNGGASWSLLSQEKLPIATYSGRHLLSVCFTDSLNGWITTSDGCLLKTADGGLSWSRLELVVKYGWPWMYKIRAFQGRFFLACGSRSTVVTSPDSGKTWVPQTSGLQGFFHTTRNIAATITGAVTPERECVVLAHYDSYSNDPMNAAPGADDNASGVSAVLEAARILKDYQFESSVTLLAVSAEEGAGAGSRDYAIRARAQNRIIVGVVNADMIGFPVTRDTTHLAVSGFPTLNWLADSARVYLERYRIGANLALANDSLGVSDHVAFSLAGYDAVWVSEGTHLAGC